MIANLVLFASAAPDQMLAGAAVLATICGIVLLGGRSVISLPLQVLWSLKPRHPHRMAAVRIIATPNDANAKVSNLPLRRVA